MQRFLLLSNLYFPFAILFEPGLARAISGGVDILLADEPTGNLDSKNAEAVMGILQSLNEDGTTICMVTHDERFAKAAGREIGLLDGKVLQAVLDK